MSDHEFERQVRQKLNPFKMSPSAEAWVNIEERIRERRRRELPLFLLSLLVFTIGTGGYYMLRSTSTPAGEKVVAAKHASSVTDIASHKHESNVYAQPKSSSQIAKINNSTSSVSDLIRSKTQAKGFRATSKTLTHKYTTALNNRRSIPDVYSDGENSGVINDKPLSDNSVATASVLPHVSFDGDKLKSSLYHSYASVGNKLNKAPDKTSFQPEIRSSKIFNTPAINKVRKWSFALTGYAGAVTLNDGSILNINSQKVEDVSRTAASSNQNFSPRPIPGNFRPGYTPSTISPGPAFSIGALARRNLSDHVSVSAGLTYSQYNTLSKVGQRINSAQVVNNGTAGYLYVQNYYLVEETQETVYHNRYHFIELPVNMHYRINLNKQLPLYLNGGLVLGRLIESNALHFDGTTGVYYKNDRLINQTQVGINGGVSFVLFRKTATPLWIGPAVRSNLSTILKKEISQTKRLITGGIDLKLFLR